MAKGRDHRVRGFGRAWAALLGVSMLLACAPQEDAGSAGSAGPRDRRDPRDPAEVQSAGASPASRALVRIYEMGCSSRMPAVEPGCNRRRSLRCLKAAIRGWMCGARAGPATPFTARYSYRSTTCPNSMTWKCSRGARCRTRTRSFGSPPRGRQHRNEDQSERDRPRIRYSSATPGLGLSRPSPWPTAGPTNSSNGCARRSTESCRRTMSRVFAWGRSCTEARPMSTCSTSATGRSTTGRGLALEWALGPVGVAGIADEPNSPVSSESFCATRTS